MARRVRCDRGGWKKKGSQTEIDRDTELLISDQNGRTGHRKTDTDSYSQDFNEDRHANFHFVH